ncbi:MAG: discoidin domain-containing protein [Chitinophagaceae bacterium]
MKINQTSRKRNFLSVFCVGMLAQLAALAQSSPLIMAAPYVNVAQGKTATASAADDEAHAAMYAVDGNKDTRFSSGYDDNQWLSVDMGKAYLVNHMFITWEKSYARDFDILFSNNGSFTDLNIDSVQVRNRVHVNSSIAGIDTIQMKSGTVARYVRMKGIKRATSKGYSIWEMQVMGATAATGLFPVSVTGFTAAAVSESSQLEWITITEFATAGFTVERSSDAINFNAIAWLAGRNTGTVTSRYAYTDKQALAGKNYYRLKQIWLDGRIGYSQVIIGNVSVSTSVKTFPVPVTDHLTVDYKGIAGERIGITLFNAAGLPVYNTTLVVQSSQQPLTIARTANMATGEYFLSIQTPNNKTFTKKIIVR